MSSLQPELREIQNPDYLRHVIQDIYRKIDGIRGLHGKVVRTTDLADSSIFDDLLKRDGSVTVTGNIDFGKNSVVNFVMEGQTDLPANPEKLQMVVDENDNVIKIYFDGEWRNLVGLIVHNHETSGGGGQLDHGDAMIAASLLDDDHTIYFLADGTRELTGQLKLSGDITPSQIIANQDDYNPTGLSGASTLRLDSDASRDITGLQGGSDGRFLLIHNVGSNDIVLKDESASSSAANRFALNSDVTIKADNLIVLQYDSTSSRWRAISGGSSLWESVSGFTKLSTAEHIDLGTLGKAITHPLTNKSGATTTVGYVYRLDPDNDNSFDYATEGEDAQAVVAMEAIADNSTARVHIGSGIVDVYVDGLTDVDISQGIKFLYFGSVNGRAKVSAERNDGCIGEAIADSSGAGLVKAYIFPRERIRKWESLEKESKRKRLVLPVGRPVKGSSNPVLSASEAWENNWVLFPTIIFDYEENLYKMWFTGGSGGAYNRKIGYATATATGFPATWSKYGSNPIISPRSGDGGYVEYPSVIKRGPSDYIMYVHVRGINLGIWYLTSTDGITWTWGSKVISVGASGTWDDIYVFYPSVTMAGNWYFMLYGGFDGSLWKLGMAYSEDGTTWVKYGSNPILSAGASGEWDDAYVVYPTLFYSSGIFYIIYTARRSGTNYRFGRADSNNVLPFASISFEKYINNPIIDYGGSGEFDENRLISPCLIRHKELFYLFYAGRDNSSNYAIGYATIEV